MSQSPLMKFAIESLEHALEQYILGTDKSRRFSILHCDQAIELEIPAKRALKLWFQFLNLERMEEC